MIILNTVTSTSDEVWRIVLGASGNGGGEAEAAVMARSQTSGRGRAGHVFTSDVGGLYLSFSHRPPRPLSECLHLTTVIPLAVLGAIESSCGIRCGIKPPNDLLLEGKKVCGILTESRETPKGPIVVFGIGINLTNPLPTDVPHAGRLGNVCTPEALAEEILKQSRRILEDSYNHALLEKMKSEYERAITAYSYE